MIIIAEIGINHNGSIHLAHELIRQARNAGADIAKFQFYDPYEIFGPEGTFPNPEALAQALTADGYAASVVPAASDTADQLCQHHCPVAHVAEEFPQFCEAEAEAFSRLLGSHVTRLATIGHGDGVCTTHVPRVEAPLGRTAS